MRFSRISLENWRNFGDVNVPLQNRAYLVGANASGKSNLLDAFRFLRDLVVPGGGFEKAVSSRGGVSRIRNLAARRYSNITVEVDLEENDKVKWRYRVVFNQDKQRRPILKEEKVWRSDNSDPILDRPDKDDGADEERLRQTHLEQTFANRVFREIVDFFESVDYFHLVPQLVRDADRATGRQADPFGEDFLEQIAKVSKRSQVPRLRRIQKVLKVAIPQLRELEFFRDERGIPHLRGKYEHWREHGAWQDEADFSDGTLRLIGLLWTLMDGKGPLLLEEPELSLHPGVVRHLPQMMLRIQRLSKQALRQTFVSTHSGDLLMDTGIAPDEVFLFIPSEAGTTIRVGATQRDMIHELRVGLTLAEVVLPRTEPVNVEQLSFLGN
jgi:predicted ATPase